MESPHKIAVWSDASETGWDSHAAQNVANGIWSPLEAKKSSTWRELWAALNIIKALIMDLARVLCVKNGQPSSSKHIAEWEQTPLPTGGGS